MKTSTYRILTVVCIMIGCVGVGMTALWTVPVDAAAPVVVKTGTTYTVTVTDPATSVTASPTDGSTPWVAGGCVLHWHRNARGRVIIDGVACPTPGTVTFHTQLAPACETPFTIAVDGVEVYTESLNSPCPPPPPPAVVIVRDGDVVFFANPADVAQTVTTSVGVPSADSVLTADGPIVYTVYARYAGIGINRYVYFEAVVTVALDAAQVVTVVIS